MNITFSHKKHFATSWAKKFRLATQAEAAAALHGIFSGKLGACTLFFVAKTN
jgi:hypothetical protein